MTKRALVLFAHGARDPRWAVPFERMQQLSQAQLPDVAVSLAFLELMSPRLPETVAQLVNDGYEELTVVPVFLGQGGHVLRDLPELVAKMTLDYPQLKIKVADAVGENPHVLNAIAQVCVASLLPQAAA